MSKTKKIFKKSILMLFALFSLISALAIPSFAYSEDSKGNLVSDNLINYKDIDSDKFTDLGDNSFRLDWRGGVSTITLPYSSFEANTQYSLTITKVSGAHWWAFQFFWNYSDNTNERFTNSQGLANGTYSYTSASNKTLSSITIVLNYEADFKDLMLNKGQPKSYDPYGYTYYSQENYKDALNNDYGIFRLCSSIDLTLTWIDGSNRVQTYSWDNILALITDKTYIKCSNGVFSYNNSSLSMDLLGGSSNAKAMWQFNFNGIYPQIKQFPTFIASGYDLRYQIVDAQGSLFAYDNITNDAIVDLSQYNLKQIGYIQLYTGAVAVAVNFTTLYFSNDYNIAYTNGYNAGYEVGQNEGQENGMDLGYQEGFRDGKIEGYDNGYNEALGEDISSRGFWGLLNSIMSYPVNMIKSVFNFEFMGINIAGLITFIVSIVLVIFIVHRFKK